MSSGAKRLVQSLRGRSGGGGGGGGGGHGHGRSGSGRSDSHGGGGGDGGGGAAASTSATRLFHYDSGHELDEISVIARNSEDLTTPTTPYHCGGGGAIRYGSGQTLYSIAGSVPPAPAAPLSRVAPGGIVTSGGGVVSGNELRERHRTGNGRGGGGPGCRGDDDTKSVENVSARSVLPSRQSLLDLVSSKFMGRHTPTHHYYHAQQQQRYFSSSRDSLQGAYVNRGASELDLSRKSRRKDHLRGRFKLPNAVTLSTTSTPGHETTPSHLHTPASINHLGGNTRCNGTETGVQYRRLSSIKLLRYTAQQQQQQRGSRGYPGQSGSRGFRTGAPNWSFVFDPAGRLCYYWSMVVSLAFLYNFWVIIYRFAFQEINGETLVVWFCLDYLSDFLYLVDIVFHFRTGYLEDGVLQTDATKLRTHYMNSTTFYIDCLCLLPLDCLYLSIGFNSILRSFRLVKIYRFWAFMDRTERHTNYPNLFRSTSLIHYLLVIFHWNGCLYHIIYKNNGFGSKNWVFSDSETADVVKQYLQSYYWCTLALTTIGDLPRPRSKGEYLFVIAQLLFGLLLFATVLGHVANIVTSVSAARKEFQAKLDGVKTYMRMRRVPNHLQVKVIKWFDYLWLTQKCSDEEKAVSCLPDKLKAEIAINVHLDTLKRVEIFQNTEAGFLCELVLRLRPVLFSPGDYICRKGEVGKEMYIVNRGRLQVVADNGKTVLATLKAGSYFGEISILNMGTAGKECGNRRTASVRSVGYSDLFVLSKKDMWDVLKEYPAARVRLEAIAVKRLEKYKRAPLEKGMTCNSMTHLMSEGTTPLFGHEPLLAEIKRLRDRLVCLESENASMSLKLNQKQWEVEHRLAEIELQICGASSTSSVEDNERNRESII
ncbi:cyclic nucleotide-gated cation channel alpha-3 isoform X5 [Nasonia vitripennis]|uniref:Cyclic nucleotide-binding domain-containing protein n=1 Tax=Nasonia vitripennis TaxID=7425 RepID=A0A7M7IRC9_NASVI|nr:cyclic nucleotide-gated cation channel alpha-3 isoform X5 [Nasonia vitripennis]